MLVLGEFDYFLFLEASTRFPNTYADVVLPKLKHSFVYCLTFYYHLYGRNIGFLRVILFESDGSETVAFEASKVGGMFQFCLHSYGVRNWQCVTLLRLSRVLLLADLHFFVSIIHDK